MIDQQPHLLFWAVEPGHQKIGFAYGGTAA